MEPLTSAQMEAIADRLAWSDGSLDEEVSVRYGVDLENLDKVMERSGYEWDYVSDRWISKQDIWNGWDGKLPSQEQQG